MVTETLTSLSISITRDESVRFAESQTQQESGKVICWRGCWAVFTYLATRRHSNGTDFFADMTTLHGGKKRPKARGYTDIDMWEMLSHFSMEKRISPDEN